MNLTNLLDFLRNITLSSILWAIDDAWMELAIFFMLLSFIGYIADEIKR